MATVVAIPTPVIATPVAAPVVTAPAAATAVKPLTQASIETARKNNNYIKVENRRQHLVLSGAPKRWLVADNANDIYVPAFRLVGTKDKIVEILKASGVSDENIDVALTDAYTKDNQAAKKEQFEAEIAAKKQATPPKKAKAQATPPRPAILPGEKVHNFGDNYDLERLAKNNAELHELITDQDDETTQLLRRLIREKKILLADKEDMGHWEADAVVLLKDGRILLTHAQ